ncbi:Helix-turn-helix [Variovorax sp. YR752]|uniref:helix-turn-helix domain-containing protein n=1 Tax=Variovorax sp. YR752 TaxID=1884383 RepID=UPI000BCC3062|nr:helix-turn-helix domain-containing protein [Variovorax sp. YR752]SOD27650.1 Helix-turn-helix [Variovorax sp. YR752]
MNTEIRSLMGSRLAEERERLKLKQPDFAALGGTKTRTLQDWERGIAAPGTEFLAAVGQHGVDLLYVLTGTRTPSNDGSSLSAEERALVDNYQHADEEGRAAARRVLSSLAKQKTG